MSTHETDGESAWRPGHVLALAALGLAMGTAFNAMGSFSTVQEGAKAELALSDYDLSLIQGVAAAIPLALFSIPIGLLVDRTRRVTLLLVLAACWVGGTLLTALAPNATWLFVARMLTATGATSGITAALSLGADLARPEQRGRATLIITLGQRIGIATAFAIPGWLFGAFGHGAMANWFGTTPPWRSVHFALALGSALLFVPLLFLREPARHETAAGPHAAMRVVFGELWARRGFLAPLFAGQVAVVMADTAAIIWAAPVLQRSYGLQPQDFAGWMGALVLVTGLVGAIIGGFAADAGQSSGRRGGILIGAIVAAAIGVPAALFPVGGSVPVFAVALGALTMCGTITGIIVAVALTVLLPNELRGLCVGAFIALAGLIGYGVAPPLVAAISERLGGEAHLGAALAIVGVAVSALSLLAFILALRRAPTTSTNIPI